jgi:hypothetical protein
LLFFSIILKLSFLDSWYVQSPIHIPRTPFEIEQGQFGIIGCNLVKFLFFWHIFSSTIKLKWHEMALYAHWLTDHLCGWLKLDHLQGFNDKSFWKKSSSRLYKRHAFPKTINCDKISSVQVWIQTCHWP